MNPRNDDFRKFLPVRAHRRRIAIDQKEHAAWCLAQPAMREHVDHFLAGVLEGVPPNSFVKAATIWAEDRWHFRAFLKMSSSAGASSKPMASTHKSTLIPTGFNLASRSRSVPHQIIKGSQLQWRCCQYLCTFHQPDHFLIAEVPALPPDPLLGFLVEGIEVGNETCGMFT